MIIHIKLYMINICKKFVNPNLYIHGILKKNVVKLFIQV